MASDKYHRPCLPLKPQEKRFNLYTDEFLKKYYYQPDAKNK